MTGFLLSLVARASGMSAPGPFQFATLPARPLPQAKTTEASPSMPVTASVAPTQAPREIASLLDVTTEDSPPAARPVIRVQRRVEPQTDPRRPLADVAPNTIAQILQAPTSVSPAPMGAPEPTPRARETPTTAPVQTVPPPDAASAVHTETIRIERETSREKVVTERHTQVPNRDAAPPPRMSFSPVPAEPPPPAAAPVVEIGRIEIVLTQPPAAPLRQEPERTRGFASYEHRRLGPRR